MSLEFERRLAGDQKRIEEALGAIFREDDRYADLQEAMEYSLMAGGKRVRPVLTLECCRLCGGDPERALPFACGVEMVHTYSLIHDDLPCMDDDDLRRGFPTCHKQFDEATAIIAGDGLLTYAFEILSRPSTAANPAVRCYLIEMLANAAGAFNGMVAGQMLDLIGAAYSVKDNDKEDLIRHIEEMKTGRLLRYAVEAGAALGGADEEQTKALISYSRRIGIAFQIADDILDVTGDERTMGKTLHKDEKQNKLTFVSLYGLENARRIAAELTAAAREDVAVFGSHARNLQNLASYIIERQH